MRFHFIYLQPDTQGFGAWIKGLSNPARLEIFFKPVPELFTFLYGNIRNYKEFWAMKHWSSLQILDGGFDSGVEEVRPWSTGRCTESLCGNCDGEEVWVHFVLRHFHSKLLGKKCGWCPLGEDGCLLEEYLLRIHPLWIAYAPPCISGRTLEMIEIS